MAVKKKMYGGVFFGRSRIRLRKGEILSVWAVREDRVVLKTKTGIGVPIIFEQYKDIESFEKMLFNYFELK